MRAGDKATDLGSRREGTVLILESRPTAPSCQPVCLREAEPPGRERSAPAAGAPASGGQRRPNEFLEVPAFWDFPVIF